MKSFNKNILCLTFFAANIHAGNTHYHNHNTQHTYIVNGIDISKHFNKKYSSLFNWFKSNKLALSGVGAASGYALIANKIAQGKTILYSNDNWTNWKNDTDLTDLLNKKSSTLQSELNQSILNKYANNDQSDLITPVVQFVNDLEKELAALKVFCKIGKKLQFCRLTKVFLITNKEITLANEKINRLLYIKNIITNSIKISLNNQ
jgi:hypothetical protein